MTLKLNGTNSEAAPAYAGDDADTGLQCGTNELKLVTGGSARVTVDSSGNLGIGTTSPTFTAGGGIHNKGVNAFTSFRASVDSNTGIDFAATTDGKGYLYNRDNADLIFGTNNTERMRILSSGGLTFNGDTAAANALDDYEEGTWTPTAAGGHTGISVDTANCVYVKVGRLVTLHFEIYYPTGISGSLFKIGGVPFQIDEESIGGVMLNSVDFPTNRTMVSLYGNNSELRLYGSGSGQSWGGLGGDDVTTDASILGTITYRST